MPTSPEYRLSVEIEKGSKAWDRLLTEIPVGAELQEAHFIFVPGRASIALKWVGRKPDGTKHLRTTLQNVGLSDDFGGPAFLYEAYPNQFAEILEAFMPPRPRASRS